MDTEATEVSKWRELWGSRKQLLWALFFALSFGGAVEAQGREVFDATRLEFYDVLSLLIVNGMPIENAVNAISIEKSGNEFEDRRQKKKLREELEVRSKNPKYRKLAVFQIEDFPSMLTTYDFDNNRFGFCVPRTIHTKVRPGKCPVGSCNTRSGTVDIVNTEKLSTVNRKCEGRKLEGSNSGGRIRILGGATVKLPMPSEAAAETLYNAVETSGSITVDINCVRNRSYVKSDFLPRVDHGLTSCTVNRYSIKVSGYTLAEIRYTKSGWKYDFHLPDSREALSSSTANAPKTTAFGDLADIDWASLVELCRANGDYHSGNGDSVKSIFDRHSFVVHSLKPDGHVYHQPGGVTGYAYFSGSYSPDTRYSSSDFEYADVEFLSPDNKVYFSSRYTITDGGGIEIQDFYTSETPFVCADGVYQLANHIFISLLD